MLRNCVPIMVHEVALFMCFVVLNIWYINVYAFCSFFSTCLLFLSPFLFWIFLFFFIFLFFPLLLSAAPFLFLFLFFFYFFYIFFPAALCCSVFVLTTKPFSTVTTPVLNLIYIVTDICCIYGIYIYGIYICICYISIYGVYIYRPVGQ